MITQSLFQDKNNKRAKEKEMRGGRHRRRGKKSEQEAAPANTDGGSRLEISVVVSTFSCHKCPGVVLTHLQISLVVLRKCKRSHLGPDVKQFTHTYTKIPYRSQIIASRRNIWQLSGTNINTEAFI